MESLLTCIVASYLIQQLKNLQEGLLLFKIQQIQRNEKLIFELYVSNDQFCTFYRTLTISHRGLGLLMVYDYHILDATLKLVMNLKTKNYRLLFSNASKSICLSIESMFVSYCKTHIS